MAQLFPMSDDIIAFLGRAAWMARQAILGLIQSGLSALALWFHVVPGSSSS